MAGRDIVVLELLGECAQAHDSPAKLFVAEPAARLVTWFCEEDLAGIVKAATDTHMGSLNGTTVEAC